MSHSHWDDGQPCLLSDKECDELMAESSEIDDKQILDETIMLLDTQLSAVKLRLTGMDENNVEKDVLQLLERRLTQDVMWYKGLKIGISEGYI